MNNADSEKKLINDNIVLDVFIICQKLTHVQVILKNTVLFLRDLQNNPPKHPQSSAIDVKGTLF